jgi:hypothetical protein
MNPIEGKNFIWRASDHDPMFPEDDHEICNNEGDYCYYYPRQNKLVMSEQGYYFDDHAVAVFKVRNREHAEDIIRALVKIKTC